MHMLAEVICLDENPDILNAITLYIMIILASSAEMLFKI